MSATFALTAVVPLLLTTAITGYKGEKALVHAVFKQNQNLAERTGDSINQMFREKIRMLRIVSNSADVTRMDVEKQTILLKSVAEHDTDFQIVIIADIEGKQIARSDGRPASPEIDYNDRPYFLEVLESGRTAISEVLVAKSTGRLGIVIAEPIFNELRQIEGVLIANLELSRIVKQISQVSLGEKGYVFIVDNLGRIVLHPNWDLVETAADVSSLEPVKSAINGYSGWSEYTDAGQTRLAGYSYIETTGWGLIAQQPMEEALASVYDLNRTQLGIAGLAAIIAAILGVEIAGMLTRPLTNMAMLARRLADGGLEASLYVTAKDEVGQLADALNHMLSKLRRREEKLREAHDELDRKVRERTRELVVLNQKLMVANDKLQKASLLDGLTGIANRRYFEDYLRKEWQRAKREQEPISLIMLDVDYFKDYNDTYGHIAGDECLREIASALQAAGKRAIDLAARYGGEEFALVLPNTDQNGAGKVAEYLLMKVRELGIVHEKSAVSNIVSVSLGVASVVPSEQKQPSELVAAADRALYQAKAAGRNRWQLGNP